MDWHSWIDQPFPFTEIKRGGATVWPRGGKGLLDDSLGPVLHSHDVASEIFYFISGRCRLEVGDTEELFNPGDFILVPPDVPHNLWNAGDDDLLVFWIVAPNLVNNKWRTENFRDGAMSLRGFRSHVAPGAELPSDAQIRSRVLTLKEEDRYRSQLTAQQEAIVYLLDGQAEVRIGEESKTFRPNQFVEVPQGSDWSASPVGSSANILLFEMPGV
jgi:mannose-6-phosphate isomerase-like protein (cupin superfamily)